MENGWTLFGAHIFYVICPILNSIEEPSVNVINMVSLLMKPTSS